MNIKMKAALRVGALIGWAFVGVIVFYILKMFLSVPIIIGICVGALIGSLLYNLYKIFLAIEEMNEQAKK